MPTPRFPQGQLPPAFRSKTRFPQIHSVTGADEAQQSTQSAKAGLTHHVRTANDRRPTNWGAQNHADGAQGTLRSDVRR